MQKKIGKDKLVVVTVAVDELDDKERAPKVRAAVAEFLTKIKADGLIHFHLDNVDSEELDRRFRNIAPPIYYVFNREGKWVMPEKADEVEGLVHKFLGEK
jgi:hypothetical protein